VFRDFEMPCPTVDVSTSELDKSRSMIRGGLVKRKSLTISLAIRPLAHPLRGPKPRRKGREGKRGSLRANGLVVAEL
jgi:hypothetical protein